MRYDSEEQLKKKLKIDSWRNLSKEKFLDYIALIPNVSEEIQLKVLENLPECLSFTKDLTETMKFQLEKIVDENSNTTSSVIKSLDAIQKSLDSFGSKPELSNEDLRYIIDKQMELAKMYIELSKDDKEFLDKIWSGVVTFGVVVLLFIGAILGLKKNDNET
ncbi:hypothetical protein DSECCO2_520970 [anaerobic digester metagenome]